MSGPALSKLIYLSIMGVMIAGLVLLSLRSLVALARLSSGATSTGRIIAKRIDDDDGRFYFVTYAFEDAAGTRFQREIQLRKAAYGSLREGQSTSIAYQIDDPDNSYLGDPQFRRSHVLAMCGWLLVAAVLSFIAYEFLIACVMLDRCPSES
jgi:amino acid transporter